MDERKFQFRVGVLVIAATIVGSWLVIRFGDLQRSWHKHYEITVRFDSAAGVYPSAPVLLNGVVVGAVQQVVLDGAQGGVMVSVEIRDDVKLRSDSLPMVARSLLGETAIEFSRGTSKEFLEPGSTIQGQGAPDPMVAVQRLEHRASQALEVLAETSQEWKLVAANLNGLMDTHRGNFDVVIEQAAEALHQLTLTLQTTHKMVSAANKLVADPEAQRALKETMVSMPELVTETRQTILTTRKAVENINRNLVNLAQVTEPIGQRGELMVRKLDSSLGNLDSLLGELNHFAKLVNSKDGTLQKFAADPSLYENLDRSSQSLAVLLKNLEPMIKDLREFSDKIARNPEILGVGGALRPSAGLKDQELIQHQSPSPPRSNIKQVRGQSMK
jgi:phospholipid/cholesterol/gamma-HCH transport system substrate-binding protein